MGNTASKWSIFFTLVFAKGILKGLRFFKLGATTLPGRLALAIYPNLLHHLSNRLERIIIVTGTNGKTTTCRMIGKVLTEAGMRHFTNKSGANLLTGIASTLIENASVFGTFKTNTALFETDEAAFAKVTRYLSPHYVVITNFFRDQLDRYGELYTTVKNVEAGILASPASILIANADDSLVASIVKNTQNPVHYFGFSDEIPPQQAMPTVSDASYCVYCKTKYSYQFRSFGHLGAFHCPGCGFERSTPEVTLQQIHELSSHHSEISIHFEKDASRFSCQINLPGLYNIYNALSACALGQALQIPTEKLKTAMETFECGFGRMETIETDGKFIKVILVKNPTGFNQVLHYLLTEDKQTNIAFIINDNAADGTDISWLWDVDFEQLEAFQAQVNAFVTAGKRGSEMALRLKYAGIFKNKIETMDAYEQLIAFGLSNTPKGHHFYILPTYTALMEIRKLLTKKFKLKEFWQ